MSLKPQVGKTSVLIWIKLHKCPCKVHHVDECYKQLDNLAQGHNTAISQENLNDPPMPLNLISAVKCNVNCEFEGTSLTGGYKLKT